jgi:hypothetical protein
MTSSFFRTASGQCSYAQIVTICLLALGVGAAALVYLWHQRGETTTAASMESMGEPWAMEQKLLGDLAKSKNRSFSNEQVTTLRKELSTLQGERIAIECTMGDLDSCYLALEIHLVFEASGWIVEEFLFATQATPGKAVILRIKDASMRDRAEHLARLLRSVGLSVTTRIDPAARFDLKIVVPSKQAQKAQETPA